MGPKCRRRWNTGRLCKEKNVNSSHCSPHPPVQGRVWSGPHQTAHLQKDKTECRRLDPVWIGPAINPATPPSQPPSDRCVQVLASSHPNREEPGRFSLLLGARRGGVKRSREGNLEGRWTWSRETEKGAMSWEGNGDTVSYLTLVQTLMTRTPPCKKHVQLCTFHCILSSETGDSVRSR